MNSTLNQPMLITTNRIQTIIQSRGSITLSELEGILDASYNLIFLAIDYLSPENPPQTPRCRDRPLGLSLSCWTDLKVCPYVYACFHCPLC